MKTCKICGKTKPLLEFNCNFYDKTRAYSGKFTNICKHCNLEDRMKKRLEKLKEFVAKRER